MVSCIEEYEYKLKSDDEYKNIVKSTIFNILMGKDSNGCLINFSNDIGSSIVDTKDYNVNNLDELLESSVKKIKDYMEIIFKEFLDISSKKLDNGDYIYKYDGDYFGEYNELLYYFTEDHAYKIICKMLPIRKVFGGDSNGSLNFESEVANFIRSHLPTKNDIINYKMNLYTTLINFEDPIAEYFTITLHEVDNIYEYRKEILEKLIKFYDNIEITSKEYKEDMFYFDIKLKWNKS